MSLSRSLLPLSLITSISLAVLALVACDQTNRPMNHPSSAPRTSCFSDVECPSSQMCVKGADDIQGTCTPHGSPDYADGGARGDGADGGGEGGAPFPLPSVTPAPGDIRI